MKWKEWVTENPECTKFQVEVVRLQDGIFRGRATLSVFFLDDAGEVLRSQHVEWEAAFEQYLIEELRAPSRTVASEIVRFAQLLHESFKPVWREVPGGYFDAVLVQILQDGDYRDHPAVHAMLAHARPGTPSPTRLTYTRAFIEAALGHVGGRLALVRPDLAEADDILARALASWMDERFSVSSRRLLGMLPEVGAE